MSTSKAHLAGMTLFNHTSFLMLIRNKILYEDFNHGLQKKYGEKLFRKAIYGKVLRILTLVINATST
jgi:hypothetical protein